MLCLFYNGVGEVAIIDTSASRLEELRGVIGYSYLNSSGCEPAAIVYIKGVRPLSIERK